MKNNLSDILDFSKSVVSMPNTVEQLSDDELAESLSEFPEISAGSLIIVNDHQRSTPTYRVVNALRKAGKIRRNLDFLMATGTHFPPSLDDSVKLIGADKNDKILFHNVNRDVDYSYAGTTSRGTKVLYNNVIDNYDSIITIGSVEPHYFAGFTGGAKSLLPGITALETVRLNHRWALDDNSSVMRTVGNPVFEDIWEGAGLIFPLKKIQSIQLVNHGSLILGLCSGGLEKAFNGAKEISEKTFCREVERKFDRIISLVESPLDMSIYQAQKALENSKKVLRDNGSLVLVASCNKGIGNMSFYNCLSKFERSDDVIKGISFTDYCLGEHKAYKFAETALKHKLYYVGNLDEDTVSNVFMKKISEIQLADLYNKWVKNGDRILIDNAGGFNAFYLA